MNINRAENGLDTTTSHPSQACEDIPTTDFELPRIHRVALTTRMKETRAIVTSRPITLCAIAVLKSDMAGPSSGIAPLYPSL